MMAGKVVGIGFEMISELDSYLLITVLICPKVGKEKKLESYNSLK